MNIENRDIENIFQKSFSEYEIQPSDTLWEKLEGKLSRKEFFSFSPGSFNVYYLVLLLSAIALGIFLMAKSMMGTDDNEGTKLSTDSQIEKTDISSGKSMILEMNNSAIVEESIISGANEIDNKGGDEDPVTVNTKEPISDIRTVEGQSYVTLNEGKMVELIPEVKKNNQKLQTSPPITTDNSTEVLISFSVFPKSGCAPLNVEFENYSRIKGAFEWHFGDGGKSTQEEPVYLFDEPGEYVVSLAVFMEDGSVFSAKKMIEVYAKPKAAFEIYHDNLSDVGQPVVFLNYSKGADKNLWSFGDGYFSEEVSPEHYYNETGKYNVKLKVISDEGCADSTIITNAFENAGCQIEFPTAFLPNINGPSNGYYSKGLTTNEVFHPEHKGVMEYHLKIFSRNGLLIFESNDINRGWDGYMNDRLAKRGVYVWKVRGRFSNGQTFVKFGNVTLITK
ncbi:MAG: gliding motility-associated C-terminal domain-containing protein [Bacteroidales bacterium]|nr:gliding motility-associated C-terminal domain-containing protein [Bacteroidales bacterium]